MKKRDSDIDALLASLKDDATQYVASPDTIEQLKSRGVEFNTPQQLTDEQFIDKLFTTRKEAALKVAGQFPAAPRIAIPTIMSLYEEIQDCILFGLNGAAISLSAILVEFSLKHAIVNHAKGTDIYDKAEWDRLENKELGPVIEEAAKLKIIGDEEKKNLIKFKNETRNLYMHYNIKKITAGVDMRKAKKINIAARTIEEQDLSTKDNPIIWQSAKKFVDKENVMAAFSFADSVVKFLFPDAL